MHRPGYLSFPGSRRPGPVKIIPGRLRDGARESPEDLAHVVGEKAAHGSQRVKALQLSLGQGSRIRYWGNYRVSKSGFNAALTVVERQDLVLLMHERMEAERKERLR